MNQELYKEKLRELAEKRFENMNVNFEEYIEAGLKYIGTTDSELRDDLNYPFLATAICDNLIGDEKINDILKTLSGDTHLFYQIDDSNSDSVFTRTFSALIIAVIVAENSKKKYISNETLDALVERLKIYLTKEKDFRGFITDKGWAHSVAHVADVIKFLATNESVSSDKIMELLFLHRDMFMGSNEVFTHDEDERIIDAIDILFERSDFDESSLLKWIEAIDNSKLTNVYPDDLYTIINSKLLLRSLYFKLLKKDNSQNIINGITKQLDIFN